MGRVAGGFRLDPADDFSGLAFFDPAQCADGRLLSAGSGGGIFRAFPGVVLIDEGQRRLEVGFNPLLTFHSYLGTLFLMKPRLHTGFHACAFPAKLLERSELPMPRPKRFLSF
jgi:hypothetical protein